jgi:hypothetical protein
MAFRKMIAALFRGFNFYLNADDFSIADVFDGVRR